MGVKRESDLLYVSHINFVITSTHRLCAALLRMFITRNSNTFTFAYYTIMYGHALTLRAHNVKLILPSSRTNILKCSFAYRTSVIYNMLPINVLSASSLHMFVARLWIIVF